MAADLAVSINGFPPESAGRQKSLLKAIGLPTTVVGSISPVKIYKAMFKDKKAEKGKLRLVLPDRIGKVSLVKEADGEAVLEAISGRMS
jgi:3-dehydroquinate synthetase